MGRAVNSGWEQARQGADPANSRVAAGVMGLGSRWPAERPLDSATLQEFDRGQ